MKTQKPLKELIPEINAQFNKYREQLQFDLDLYQMHEGQVKKMVEISLSKEMFSSKAYDRAIQRIPSINIARKVTDKLSKVYAESPIRFSDKDQDTIELFSNCLNLDANMNHGNRMANLHNRSALEIYLEGDEQKVRVLNAQQFFVYSDSPTSPDKMTVFCKLLGKDKKYPTTVTSSDGTRVTTEDDILLVDIIALYSETEFLIIDSDGTVREDKMIELTGSLSSTNPFGVIPFVYMNKSPSELIPYANQTAMDVGILIPKLLTDLNYSAQFQSHSVMWVKNADLQGAEINPDSLLNLGDSDGDGNDPEIGTIEPKTDINGVLQLIEFTLSFYLSTVGLKTGSIGSLGAENASSGISKIIDESDATEARKQQTELFRIVERDFWTKFAACQDYWSSQGVVSKKEKFNPSFIDGFSIKFAEIKPLESEKQKYEKMKIARELKLITKKQALKEIYPNLPETQLDQRIQELEEELNKEKKEMMSLGITPGFTQLDRQQKGKSDEKMIEDANGGTESE